VRIDILTLFPAICEGPLGESMLKRAREKGLIDIRIHNLRQWAAGKHAITDDSPYGGGQGMVMKCEPIFAAVEAIRADAGPSRVLYLSPSGRPLSHAIASGYAASQQNLILLCGHYEGVDHRLIPGVLGDENSAAEDSFAQGLLEGPQYTRPIDFRGWRVPEILLSGNHAQIAQWRAAQSLEKTQKVRPDLLD